MAKAGEYRDCLDADHFLGSGSRIVVLILWLDHWEHNRPDVARTELEMAECFAAGTGQHIGSAAFGHIEAGTERCQNILPRRQHYTRQHLGFELVHLDIHCLRVRARVRKRSEGKSTGW